MVTGQIGRMRMPVAAFVVEHPRGSSLTGQQTVCDDGRIELRMVELPLDDTR
jgi:hypothetical protein